jgi:hypothetical protein
MAGLADLDGREGVAPPERAHDEEEHECQLGPKVEGNGLSDSKEKGASSQPHLCPSWWFCRLLVCI